MLSIIQELIDVINNTELNTIERGKHLDRLFDVIRVMPELYTGSTLNALYEGKSLLSTAIINNQMDTVLYLLKEKIDVNAIDCFGISALAWSLYTTNSDIFELLCRFKNIDPDKNFDGQFSEKAFIEMTKSNPSHMLLYWAKTSENYIPRETLAGIIALHKINLELTNSEGKTALDIAIDNATDHKTLDKVGFLINHGAIINARDRLIFLFHQVFVGTFIINPQELHIIYHCLHILNQSSLPEALKQYYSQFMNLTHDLIKLNWLLNSVFTKILPVLPPVLSTLVAEYDEPLDRFNMSFFKSETKQQIKTENANNSIHNSSVPNQMSAQQNEEAKLQKACSGCSIM